jgi:membrane-associated PAP2 superfamily phosphatase
LKSSVAVEVGVLLAAGVLVWLLCERAGLDAWVSNAVFDRVRGEFPLRNNWWLDGPGHVGLKYLAWGIWVGVLAVAIAPLGRARPWRREAAHAALGIALAATAVILLRNASAHSCPWDLAMYGGTAAWFPLFGAAPVDAGPGRCLPAAHAASGFALFGLYFALRRSAPRAARLALAAAVLIGVAAGAVQVARGAHFVSHVLWTAWIAYGVNFALERLLVWRGAAIQPAAAR